MNDEDKNNDPQMDFTKEMENRIKKMQDDLFHSSINPNDHGIGTNWGTDSFYKYTAPSMPPYPTSPNTIGYPDTYDSTFARQDSLNPLIVKALQEISKRLNELDKRVGIIQEAPDDKVKALQEAYEHYKFIEKLCQGEDSERDIEKE